MPLKLFNEANQVLDGSKNTVFKSTNVMYCLSAGTCSITNNVLTLSNSVSKTIFAFVLHTTPGRRYALSFQLQKPESKQLNITACGTALLDLTQENAIMTTSIFTAGFDRCIVQVQIQGRYLLSDVQLVSVD